MNINIKKVTLSVLFAAATALPVHAQINDLVKTPPMGWNSWNVFHENINENQIKEIADVMVSSGMRDAGYIYLNLDDNWMAKTRDASGNLQADPTRFPSGMKALGDYIHAKGLKFGIYGDRGLRTCHHNNNNNSFPNSGSGSYMKEERDAKTFASWGVDYLKYDNCEPASGSNQREDYERMRDALANSGREIVFSICAWGYQDWMPQTGNLWRTTGDISNAWQAQPGDWFRGVVDIIDANEKYYTNAGPGKWNDPDMLQVGNGVLTMDESRSHMTMWAIMAAPLLTGSDLRKMSTEIKDIYTNADMIAVNQDSAGIAGHRVSSEDGKEIWIRHLGSKTSGNLAVALFNKNSSTQTINLDFSKIGVSGEVTARNIWEKKDLGILSGSFSSEVPAHGTTFLKISAKIVPQSPFDSLHVAQIPGQIEAENYDLGTSGLAYEDNDSENKGGEYRNDGVDIVTSDDGYAIGYTEVGEWLEYTAEIQETAKYKVTAKASANSNNTSMVLFLDDKVIADTLHFANTEGWENYTLNAIETIELPQGKHILKILMTGNYFNLDWMKFEALNSTGIDEETAEKADLKAGRYSIHDIAGRDLGFVEITDGLTMDEVQRTIIANVPQSGIYVIRNGKEILTLNIRK